MEVFSNGDNQEQIITLLSKHNAGECEFTLDDLSTYLKMRNYLFSIVCNTTMQIMDDGISASLNYMGKCFMKVTLEEVYDLVES